MIEKRLLVSGRLRRIPREGFSWISRRFLPEFASLLTSDALLLYFFLTSVSDKQGLSFYGLALTSKYLNLQEQVILQARNELIRHDLIAYTRPLTQVLSLPKPQSRTGSAHSLAEIFKTLGSNDSRA